MENSKESNTVIGQTQVEALADAFEKAWAKLYAPEDAKKMEAQRVSIIACMYEALGALEIPTVLYHADKLIQKLELIDSHPSYTGMCGFLYAHDYVYNGPDYGQEKANLSALLESIKNGGEVQNEPAEKENQ